MGDEPFMRLPKDPMKKLEVLKTFHTFGLMKQVIGDGSYAKVLEIADREWAAKNLKGTKRQREATACTAIVSIAVAQARKLGARLVHKRKRGAR